MNNATLQMFCTKFLFQDTLSSVPTYPVIQDPTLPYLEFGFGSFGWRWSFSLCLDELDTSALFKRHYANQKCGVSSKTPHLVSSKTHHNDLLIFGFLPLCL